MQTLNKKLLEIEKQRSFIAVKNDLIPNIKATKLELVGVWDVI